MTTFRYLTAEQWGMRWARPPIAERTPDGDTYVHHSAGPVPGDAITAFRQLNEYAITKKGYSAVDYDLMVHRDPVSGLVTIGEGRGGSMSAATLDRNEQGEAVCLLGYFHPGHALTRRPHPDEIEGVALAIVAGIDAGWITPSTTIAGHRDNPAHPGATACPGDYLQAELPTIRRRVAELQTPGGTTVKYFTVTGQPSTLWATEGGLAAFRLEGWQVAARNDIPNPIPVISEAEARRYVFVFGATSQSIK